MLRNTNGPAMTVVLMAAVLIHSGMAAGASRRPSPGVSALTAPVPAAPASADTIEGQDSLFSWRSVRGASSYTFQIARDSSFAYYVTLNVDTSGIPDTVVSIGRYLGSSLTGGTDYYWRVRASDSAGAGPYSGVSSFFLKYTFTQGTADSLDSTFDWFMSHPPDSAGSNFTSRWDHTRILDRYGFECSNSTYNTYRSYWTSDSLKADTYEDTYPILHYLRNAERHTFNEIEHTVVKKGIVIWEVYNIGIVVKTDSLCFAMDLVARGSERLVPLLDFAIVSHQYSDEFDKPFVDAMLAAGKTVYAPITYSNAGRSVVTIDSTLHVDYGNVSIRFTKGKEKPTVPGLMSQINFGPQTGDYTLYDVDDARPDFVPFRPTRHVNLMILHIANGYDPVAEVDSIKPDIAWYSHIMELQHSTASNGYRWSYNYSFNKIQYQPHASSLILTWGESVREANAVVATAVESRPSDLPRTFALYQNYPNPFNPTTRIEYRLPSAARVTVEVYDVLGRKVRTIFEGHQSAGEHYVVFDASGLPSGVYLCRLTAGGKSTAIKMMLVK